MIAQLTTRNLRYFRRYRFDRGDGCRLAHAVNRGFVCTGWVAFRDKSRFGVRYFYLEG